MTSSDLIDLNKQKKRKNGELTRRGLGGRGTLAAGATSAAAAGGLAAIVLTGTNTTVVCARHCRIVEKECGGKGMWVAELTAGYDEGKSVKVVEEGEGRED